MKAARDMSMYVTLVARCTVASTHYDAISTSMSQENTNVASVICITTLPTTWSAIVRNLTLDLSSVQPVESRLHGKVRWNSTSWEIMTKPTRRNTGVKLGPATEHFIRKNLSLNILINTLRLNHIPVRNVTNHLPWNQRSVLMRRRVWRMLNIAVRSVVKNLRVLVLWVIINNLYTNTSYTHVRVERSSNTCQGL